METAMNVLAALGYADRPLIIQGLEEERVVTVQGGAGAEPNGGAESIDDGPSAGWRTREEWTCSSIVRAMSNRSLKDYQ